MPVIALTGHLGAGKTTVLNHLLRQPGARIGVVVNDFGAVNVDAGLVTGQIDEPASIAGGCLCCLPDAGGLDDALEKLTHPRLGLDAVIVEASGLAEPASLARLIRFSGVERVPPGGLIDVVDAVRYFETIDAPGDAGEPPIRFAVATLVVINRCDQLDRPVRDRTLSEIEERVRRRNPNAPVLRTSHGRVDPALVYDVASSLDRPDELPIAAAHRAASGPPLSPDTCHLDHHHAVAVTATTTGPVSPGRLIDLAESPPEGAYRIKGTITVRSSRGPRRYVLNVVGRSIHLATAPATDRANELVAIGVDLDPSTAHQRLEAALTPYDGTDPAGLRRLQRYRRLSL